MSWLTPFMGMMQATNQIYSANMTGLQNGNAMQGMIGQAAALANKFGSDPSAMMASPEFAGLAQANMQLDQSNIVNNVMLKVAQLQAESYKKQMDQNFELEKKLNVMG